MKKADEITISRELAGQIVDSLKTAMFLAGKTADSPETNAAMQRLLLDQIDALTKGQS